MGLLALTLACVPDDVDGVVARAAGHTLTVDEAVRLIAGVEQLPPDPLVVSAVSDLWLDYTLLATALQEDSTLAQLDFGPAVRGQLEQEMILALRDSVIAPDTSVSEAEIRASYDEETPGMRVRARHILLRYPPQASATQRDSVRRGAEALLERLRRGADFAALAGEASQDPGSASRGGDLGFFERGDMVRPFEEAAFALEPGETSEVVESPFGLHIIRVEEKEVPSFDDVREEFRSRVLARRLQRAESTYIAGLQDELAMEVEDGAAGLVREMARNPSTTLSSRATGRTVVDYEGGEVTLGEVKDFLATRPGQFRQQIVQADDPSLTDFATGLAQRELLVARAREAGLTPEDAVADSLAELLRTQVRQAGASLGLVEIEPRGSETEEQALDRAVEEVLRAMISGQREVVTLGPISLVLRQGEEILVARPAFDQVVQGVRQVRGTGAQPPAGGAAPAGPTGGAGPPAPAMDPTTGGAGGTGGGAPGG
jgi:hypothetical protein